jgi:small basic protein (TIGR04137 family)
MSLDRSLKSGNSLIRHRNVLTRAERLVMLADEEKWDETKSVFGIPKVAHRKQALAKGPAKEEAATAEGAAAPGTAPAAGAAAPAAGAAPAKDAKAAAGAKPAAAAKDAKAAAPAAKKK